MPRCSIIIPAYNVESYVASTINSVLAQTYRDFEIIVVDDGSTDSTVEILDRFGPQIVCLEQKNRGPAAARNAAIRRATGEFIALLDADDLWFPSRLERMISYLDSHPGVGFATSDAYLMDEDTPTPQTYYSSYIPGGAIPAEQAYWIVQHNFVFVMAVIRRQLFETSGNFDESIDLKGVEDWDLWVRFILEGARAGLVQQPLAQYRVRREGLTNSPHSSARTHGVDVVRQRAMAHAAARAVPGIDRDVLWPEAKRAVMAKQDEKAAELFRSLRRSPGIGLPRRLQAGAGAISPALARTLWTKAGGWEWLDETRVRNSKRQLLTVVDGRVLGFVDGVRIEGDSVEVVGWAVNRKRQKPATGVAVFAGSRFVGWAPLGCPRPDVASFFDNPDLNYSGFHLITRSAMVDPRQIRVLAYSGRNASDLPRAKVSAPLR